MRYFPRRAPGRATLSAKLRVCTHCLGDLLADGRCVQCQDSGNAVRTIRQPVTAPSRIAPAVRIRQAL